MNMNFFPKSLHFVSFLFAALMLAACGSSSTGFSPDQDQDPIANPPADSTAASITISSSVTSITADGSETAIITARALDANNALLSGVPISFSATSGGLQGTNPATTNNNGEATVSLTTAGDSALRDITVTAQTASLSADTMISVVSGGVNSEVSSIQLVASPSQIGSAGNVTSNITALVKDVNNNFIPGETVTFVPDSGGINVIQPITDTAGTAIAALTTVGDPLNRTITVTANVGSVSSTVDVFVTGTSLQLSGQDSLSLGDSSTYTLILNDSSGNGIANQTIDLSSSNGNTLSSTTVVTDESGQGSFSLLAAQSGADVVTASGLGEIAVTNVTISGDEFSFISPSENIEIPLGQSQTLTVNLLQDGAGVSGETISFSSTRGEFSISPAVVTTVNGMASINIDSLNAGPAVITATTSWLRMPK